MTHLRLVGMLACLVGFGVGCYALGFVLGAQRTQPLLDAGAGEREALLAYSRRATECLTQPHMPVPMEPRP